MADRVEIRIPDFIFNEGSAFTATANFRDRATRAASVPTNAKWRLNCLSTDTTLVDWTDLTPAGEISISVPASANEIQNEDKQTELKQLTVQADRGLTTQTTGRVLYRVRNLKQVT